MIYSFQGVEENIWN